jgi:hypothetical protein
MNVELMTVGMSALVLPFTVEKVCRPVSTAQATYQPLELTRCCRSVYLSDDLRQDSAEPIADGDDASAVKLRRLDV